MSDANDAVGGLIGLGIGLIVAKKVVDIIDEDEPRRARPRRIRGRRVVRRRTNRSNNFGGVFG